MLAKKTAKNQVTIPKKILEQLPATDYFDVAVEHGNVILKPVHVTGSSLAEIRSKMQRLGLNESSVAEAVAWARRR